MSSVLRPGTRIGTPGPDLAVSPDLTWDRLAFCSNSRGGSFSRSLFLFLSLAFLQPHPSPYDLALAGLSPDFPGPESQKPVVGATREAGNADAEAHPVLRPGRDRLNK